MHETKDLTFRSILQEDTLSTFLGLPLRRRDGSVFLNGHHRSNQILYPKSQHEVWRRLLDPSMDFGVIFDWFCDGTRLLADDQSIGDGSTSPRIFGTFAREPRWERSGPIEPQVR